MISFLRFNQRNHYNDGDGYGDEDDDDTNHTPEVGGLTRYCEV